MDAVRPLVPSGFESGAPAEAPGRATPVIEQFIEIKAANPDCLLFYRMGDFYELFFEDAEIAARALGIVLTKRGKHLGRDIPMCGVPVHRADEYLHRLIASGHRVAVCEQLEDPAEARKRGAKSVVKRNVIRLVTPGTLTEDTLLDARRNNYLLAIARARGNDEKPLRARLDRHLDRRVPHRRMRPRGARRRDRAARAGRDHRLGLRSTATPSLLLIYARCRRSRRSPATCSTARPPSAAWPPISASPPRRASARCRGSSSPPPPPASPTSSARSSAGARRCRRRCARRRAPRSHRSGHAQQSRAGAHAGRRAARIAARRDRQQRHRGGLAAAGATAGRAPHRSRGDRDATRRGRILRDRRRGAKRYARAARRRRPISPARWRGSWSAAAARAISPPSATASSPPPSSRRELEQAADVAAELAQAADGAAPARSGDRCRACRRRSPTSFPISSATAAFVRAGYDAALDEARALRDEFRRVIAALQARYAETTAVRALKIRHNNVLGYFVEVTAQHGEKLHGAAAQRDLHPSPDARRTGALHHHRAGRARSQDRQRRRPRARHRARDLRRSFRHA